MIHLSGVTKAFGGRTLFQDATLRVQDGERIGLIGPNGAGKTTLFSLILGTGETDSGQIEVRKGLRLGFLPQESAPVADETVLELACSISPEVAEAYRKLREHPDPEDPDNHDAQMVLVENEAHLFEARAKQILSGLAFRESDITRPARELSGGWIMRAHLARLLVQAPDLLMLDEPTNHLDLESLGWFQNHLKQYAGALLVISHDREFLNAICNSMVEIAYRKLHHYTGNYDDYLRQKKERYEQQLAAYENQQREIAHIQSFIDRFRYKASKAAQAQARIKQLEKIELIEAPEGEEAKVKFRFPEGVRSGHKVMELKDVEQAYGDHVIYSDLNLQLERGQRVVLVGPNGAGKSTLLKILAGVVPIRAGERIIGHQVTPGYFSQQRTEQLDINRTVLDEAMYAPGNNTYEQVRTLLGVFLFRGDDVEKKVGVLSGGEKSRLALLKLLLNPPNLLLLDEPTTHLDMASIDALATALEDYPGTLVFVSHDVYFIRRLSQQVLHVDSGVLTAYAGGYDYYLEKSQATSEKQGLVRELTDHRPEEKATSDNRKVEGFQNARERRRETALRQEAVARKRREVKKQLDHWEAEIMSLEERQEELTASMENPDTFGSAEKSRKVREELEEVVQNLTHANQQWEDATEQWMELDQG